MIQNVNNTVIDMSLDEQIQHIIHLKQNGWTPDQILTGFDQIHRDNLHHIDLNLEIICPNQEQNNKYRRSIMQKSLQIMDNGQMTGWIYFFTYAAIYSSRYENTKIDNKLVNDMIDELIPHKLVPNMYESIKCNIDSSIRHNAFFIPYVDGPDGIANYHNLNLGCVNQIFPIGCPLIEIIYYDGIFGRAFRFFEHDYSHGLRIISHNDNLKAIRELYYDLLNICDSEDCKWLEYFIFNLIHERPEYIDPNEHLSFIYDDIKTFITNLIAFKYLTDPKYIRAIYWDRLEYKHYGGNDNNDIFNYKYIQYNDRDIYYVSVYLNDYIDKIQELRDLRQNIGFFSFVKGFATHNIDEIYSRLIHHMSKLNNKYGLFNKLKAICLGNT